MGRTQWGTTNLGIKSSLYNSCFRARSSLSTCNLSLSDYIRKNTIPPLYDGNTGTTNDSFDTYVYNQGYVYGIKLKNSSPARGTSSMRLGFTQIASSSTSGGTIGDNINIISNDYSFVNIRYTMSSGNTFNGWKTSQFGGSTITTSTSYNAYYTDSNITTRSIWYASTSAASPPRSVDNLGYFAPSAGGACFSFQTDAVYFNGPSALSAPAIYNASTGPTYSPSGYYSNGLQYRLWGGSFWSGTINNCLF